MLVTSFEIAKFSLVENVAKEMCIPRGGEMSKVSLTALGRISVILLLYANDSPF